MKEFKVTYYGLDKDLLPAMEKEINTYISEGNKIYFSQVLPQEGHKNLCDLMDKSEINLILIDLSNNPNIDDALKILYYEIQVNRTIIVGLWNQFENQNLNNWHFELGIHTHFCYQLRDSGSLESLNLSLARLLNIAKEEFSFFQKTLNREFNLYCPIRINFFDTETIQIESDLPIQIGETVSCVFPALPDFPFKDFSTNSISKVNLNYPLEYQANLEYLFISQFNQIYMVKWDNLTDLEFLELNEKNPLISKNLDENQVREILKDFSNNRALSHSKKLVIKRMIDKIGKLPDYDVLKNLIIDKNFTPFKKSEDVLWKHPYKFFLVSSIEDNLNVLNTCGAQILTYVLNKKLDTNAFLESEEYVQLKTICSRLINLKEKFEKFLPTILIYNIDIENEKLKEILNYKNLIATNKEYDFKDNLNFIKKFVTSPEYVKSLNYYKNQSFKVYPSSAGPLSRGFILKKVELLSISENEIIFKSNLPFQKDISFMFLLNGDQKYFATIYKIKNDQNQSIFHGIINSLDEKEKTELRKTIIKG